MRHRALAHLALLLLAAAPAAAGIGRWTPLGPDGGAVSALAIDPRDGDTVYAGTFVGGLFKSENGGRRWFRSGEDLAGSIEELVLPAAAPERLYASTTSGPFRSADAGATWQPLYTGLPVIPGFRNPFAGALVVEPAGDVLYAVVATSVSTNRVFRSLDGGDSWRLSSRGIPGEARIFDLAASPRRPGRLWATTSAGIFTSGDRARTWTRLSDLRVRDLQVHPRFPERLYAAREVGIGSDVEVIRSADGGRTWAAARPLPDAHGLTVILIDPFEPDTLYVGTWTRGLYRTTDGGRSWRRKSNGLDPNVPVWELAADPRRRGVLYVGFNTDQGPGLFKSANGGDFWVTFFRGIRATRATAVAGDPSAPGLLYAGSPFPPAAAGEVCHGAVWRSEDAGGSWQPANAEICSMDVTSVVVAPGDGEVLIGGDLGVYRSTDRGRTWTRPFAENAPFSLRALAFDADGTRLYAATPEGVFRSPDRGATWTRPLAGYASVLTAAPDAPGLVFAGLQLAGGEPPRGAVIRSLDGGLTWETALEIDGEVLALAAGAGAGSNVWAGVRAPFRSGAPLEGGLFRSTDGGASWAFVAVGPSAGPVVALVSDPHDPAVAWAATVDGIFVTGDAGAVWTATGPGLPPAQVAALWVDPAGGTVYAATLGGGVYAFTPE